jgi:tellurium resistance protein TerD
MAITLRKGERINIGLSKISVGLGWNPNEGTGFAFDLDASAIMIGTGRLIPAEEFFVFYGNTTAPDGALSHWGDDPTGGNSVGGDD